MCLSDLSESICAGLRSFSKVEKAELSLVSKFSFNPRW